MPAKNNDIIFLSALIKLTTRPNYKSATKQVVELFKERKNPTIATAKKIIEHFGSKRMNINALEKLKEYRNAESLTGILSRNKKSTKSFVKGTINTIVKCIQIRQGIITYYNKRYHRTTPQTYEIEAKSKTEATEKYNSIFMMILKTRIHIIKVCVIL